MKHKYMFDSEKSKMETVLKRCIKIHDTLFANGDREFIAVVSLDYRDGFENGKYVVEVFNSYLSALKSINKWVGTQGIDVDVACFNSTHAVGMIFKVSEELGYSVIQDEVPKRYFSEALRDIEECLRIPRKNDPLLFIVEGLWARGGIIALH